MSLLEPRELLLRDGAPCSLRSARVEDAGALIAHVRVLLEDGEGQVALPGEFDLDEAAEREWIERHRERPGEVAIVALCGERIVGLVNVECGARRRTRHVATLGVGVQPAWRGRGVGRALMRVAVEWARAESGLEKLSLAVLTDNARAVALYRALGFVEQGRRPREVRRGPDDYVDDLLMHLAVGPAPGGA